MRIGLDPTIISASAFSIIGSTKNRSSSSAGLWKP
jgi:hypothetical protein